MHRKPERPRLRLQWTAGDWVYAIVAVSVTVAYGVFCYCLLRG